MVKKSGLFQPIWRMALLLRWSLVRMFGNGIFLEKMPKGEIHNMSPKATWQTHFLHTLKNLQILHCRHKITASGSKYPIRVPRHIYSLRILSAPPTNQPSFHPSRLQTELLGSTATTRTPRQAYDHSFDFLPPVMKLVVLVSSFLACQTTAFGPVAPFAVGRTPTTTTSLSQTAPHLSEVDEMCIENVAQLCLDAQSTDGCDLDEYEALVNQLTEQKTYHAEQVALLEGLLSQLQGVANKEDANQTA